MKSPTACTGIEYKRNIENNVRQNIFLYACSMKGMRKVIRNGVDPGEWVQINFDLIGGSSIDDVLSELNDGTLRIRLHVISIEGGSSESAVNVPEPATILLLGLGTLLLRRKRKS